MSQLSLAPRLISDVTSTRPVDVLRRKPSYTRRRDFLPTEKKLVDVVYVRKYSPDSSQPAQSTHVPSLQRQPASKNIADHLEKVAEPSPKNFVRRFLPVGAASLVLVAGLTVFGLSIYTNKQVVGQVAQVAAQANEAVGGNGELPPGEEEVPASAVASYRAAHPNMPRTVTIDKIGVNARVMQLGLLSNGALATPRNVYDTGWYDASSIPGEGGAVLIAGHVHGPTKPAVFYDLKNLDKGDVVNIERGDGKKFSYKVIKKEQVPADKVSMSSLLLPVTPGKGGVNLITCGGKLQGTDYQDRIIVYAEQV